MTLKLNIFCMVLVTIFISSFSFVFQISSSVRSSKSRSEIENNKFMQLSSNSHHESMIPIDMKEAFAKNSNFFAMKTLAIRTTVFLGLTNNIKNANAVTEPIFLDSLKLLIEAKKVLAPVEQFINTQKYDQARTNINYCLNQLQLNKAVTNVIQGSLDYCEDMDLIDAASDASARIANTAVQLDSTVYTCVFIPGDDTGAVPPNADKYRAQAYGFLKTLNEDIDILLKVSNAEQFSKAQRSADEAVKLLPSLLFTPKSKVSTI